MYNRTSKIQVLSVSLYFPRSFFLYMNGYFINETDPPAEYDDRTDPQVLCTGRLLSVSAG